MNIRPVVYFNRGRGYLLVGPLGAFDKGDVIDVPEHGTRTILGVEPDGACWAGTAEAYNPESKHRTLAQVLELLDGDMRIHAYATIEQQGQMAHVIRENRRRWGLPDPSRDFATVG